MKTPTEPKRIEPMEGDEAARAIRILAEAVRQAPGIWAVTVRECRLRGGSFDLHLIVHGETSDGDDPLPPSGWWNR